jgi:thiamine-phosphate pyrophosphorylase
MKKNKLTGIYPISPNYIYSDDDYLEKCFVVISSGINIFQFRTPYVSARKKRYLLTELYNYCNNSEVQLIINNDYHLLRYYDGAGLHIGRADLSLTKIKNLIGYETIVGFSCGSEIYDTNKLQDYGISYASLGAAYSSKTKGTTDSLETNIIKYYSDDRVIPFCIIGGIDSKNIESIISYKPDMIAISDGIFREDVDNIKKTITTYQGYFNAKE